MLNYVRHDEEFHCSIRLNYGAEIIGLCLVSLDEETGKHIVYVQNPVEVNVMIQERPDGKTVRGLGFSRWCAFSDEEFYILDGDQILTMSALGKEMIGMYEGYLISEEEEKIKDVDLAKNATPADKIKGSVGKIEDARKRFERMFKDKA
tara:strand:- start:14380 stop:14826 length:447 start_codon:yes stop_codon:yes gene_type:complete